MHVQHVLCAGNMIKQEDLTTICVPIPHCHTNSPQPPWPRGHKTSPRAHTEVHRPTTQKQFKKALLRDQLQSPSNHDKCRTHMANRNGHPYLPMKSPHQMSSASYKPLKLHVEATKPWKETENGSINAHPSFQPHHLAVQQEGAIFRICFTNLRARPMHVMHGQIAKTTDLPDPGASNRP